MFKLISHYWYTLKATLIIGYVFFTIPEIRGAIYMRHRKLRKFYLAARCLIKFLRDSKKLNCISVLASCGALGTLFPNLVGIAWIGEKMGMSVQFVRNPARNIPEFFENPVLCPHLCSSKNFAQIEEPISNIKYLKEINFDFLNAMLTFASHNLSSEYGYKIISKLTINQKIQQQVDMWYHDHIKGKCIGVHYRGTDNLGTNGSIKIGAYISYLKKILDEDSQIFACSDQAQFIDQINSAFPDRVIAKDIRRSYTHQTLHGKADLKQRHDAFIDMLILAKTELIYTVGSRFVSAIRFFNPAIKIIALHERHRHKIGSKHIPNYLPVPEEHYVREIKQEAIKEWNTPPYF